MKLYLLLLSAMSYAMACYAQPPHTFTTYTSEYGLHQKTVQDIVQDKKGFMWFTTWDGLYKFDGYIFKNYKLRPGDNVRLGSNRIIDIHEDKFGYIWGESYDARIFRFNPLTETYQNTPVDFTVQKYRMLCDEELWVETTDTELLCISSVSASSDSIRIEKVKMGNATVNMNRIYADCRGRRWLMTDNGLYVITKYSNGLRYDGCYERQHQFYNAVEHADDIFFSADHGLLLRLRGSHLTKIKLATDSDLKFMLPMADGDFLIATVNDGCFVYSPDGNRVVRRYKHGKELRANANIQDVYIDQHNDLWVSYDVKGVTHINTATNQSNYFIMKDRYGREIVDSKDEMSIYEDCNGSLWIQPAGGGFAWYDRATDRIVPFFNSEKLQSGWSMDNKITKVFTDRQCNLWISSYSNGIEKVTFNTFDFKLHKVSNENDYSGNNIRATMRDRDNNIWIGSKDNKIRVFDNDMNYLGCVSHNGTVGKDVNDELGPAYAMLQDHTGTVWIGTRGRGLLSLTPTGNGLNFNIKAYVSSNSENLYYGINGKHIYSIHEDRRHRLWVATFDNGVCYTDLDDNSDERKFISSRNRLKNYPLDKCRRARVVTSDSDGHILVGTTGGLLVLDDATVVPEKMTFRLYERMPNDRNSLTCNDIHNILQTSNGNIYISTFGGGLNKLCLSGDKVQFTCYSMQNGMPSDIFMTAIEDNDGCLWLVSEEEICRFNLATEKVENFALRNFDLFMNFNDGDAMAMTDGRLMFNTSRGVLAFSPDKIKRDDFIPSIVFTGFKQLVRNGSAVNDTASVVNIDALKRIVLPHDRNSFSIQFAALDLRYPNAIRYAYKLDGFEKNWNEIGTQRTATYTNLPKGNYTLMVKSTNSSGVAVENTRSIEIRVLPSFWETAWAYMLYVVVSLVLIIVVAYIIFVIYRLKHSIAIEQEISDLKLKLFTEISHELRTPLTLILGPIEEQLSRTDLSEKSRKRLELVYRNVDRMVYLVNQILDLRKIHNNKMRMYVRHLNIVELVKQVMSQFEGMAERKHIDFSIRSNIDYIGMWVDQDKVEKIVFNLLSNAFKYTPEGKNISTIIVDMAESVSITIVDSGIGISDAKRQSLFKRYETLHEGVGSSSYSTGIGLSLVKELVDMHHGEISVHSVENEGSSFTIKLPKGRSHFDESVEFVLSDIPDTCMSDAVAMTSNGEQTIECASDDSNKDTLLIVEDNDDLRMFLSDVFSRKFNVLEAENGRRGLELCKASIPDIVVTDVMMPEMDGIEMTMAIRNDITISHIPIFILTAKSDIDSKLEGLRAGATDYITKPFSASYLRTKVIGTMEMLKRMREKYMSKLVSPGEMDFDDSESKMSVNDRNFINNMISVIKNNMDNGELMVDDLAREVNMSRSVLFKKLKTLTGISPNEFIKDIRIKYAAELIVGDEYSIAQIAYMTGFNDSHYFSKCFKKYFGVTPTEYRENNRKL